MVCSVSGRKTEGKLSAAVSLLRRFCQLVSPPVVGAIENAADTPNILDRGTLIANEQMRYQKKSERTAALPAGVIAANGIANGA